MPVPSRPSRTILSSTSRPLVGGLLIATGVLLLLGYGLRLYVLLYTWRVEGVLGGWPLAWVLLGLVGGAGTAYVGWRVGLHRPRRPRR